MQHKIVKFIYLLLASAVLVGLGGGSAVAQPTPAAEGRGSTLTSNPEGVENQGEATQPAEGPQIAFEEITHDFGKLMEGEEAHYTFVFTNTGNQVLEIKNVKTTCGCTKAGDWDKAVDPGQTGKIPIKLKTKGVRGALKKSISVTTNVPDQERITVWLKGKVWWPIEANPRSASFGAIKDRNKSSSKTIKITSNFEERLEILSVKSSNATFRAELKTLVPGKEFELVVSTVPPIGVGSSQGSIILETSNAKKPKYELRVNCYVPVPVQVAPRRLLLYAGALPKAMERAVYVTHNVDGPMTVSDVEVNAEEVGVKVVEDIKGKRYRIVLSFPQGFTVPEDSPLKLTFKTDDPSAPSIEVPIAATAARYPSKNRRLKPASGGESQ